MNPAEAGLSIAQLISASKLIDYGLQSERCHMELSRIQGAGMLWQRKDAPEGSGVWCTERQWQRAVEQSCAITDPNRLSAELAACVTAELLEPAGSWLVESVESSPAPWGLLSGIYPLLTIDNFQCVLINWPQELWQAEVADWLPFHGGSPIVTLSLSAGFVMQFGPEPLLPEQEGGVWLEGEIRPEAGEAILWWGAPLAKVGLESTGRSNILTVKEIWPEISFHHPPIMAELGTVEMELAQVGHLLPGEQLELKAVLNSALLLYHQDNVLATARLLRGKTGLIAQIESIQGNAG